MIINLTERQINTLDRKLLKVVKDDYRGQFNHYAQTESLTHEYYEGGMSTLIINFGFVDADGNKIHHTVDIVVGSKKLDFIAGQFQEALTRVSF